MRIFCSSQLCASADPLKEDTKGEGTWHRELKRHFFFLL